MGRRVNAPSPRFGQAGRRPAVTHPSARTQSQRSAMTFACKGAIKAGQRLSVVEMEELFQRLFDTELPYHDVHGRPTVIRLSLDELERRFGRHG